MIDRRALIEAAVSRFGLPYKFGAKWDPKSKDPQGPVDCSGLTKWAYAQIGITIPDGSTEQHIESVSPGKVMPGDLVFLEKGPGQGMHHVGLVYDDYFVIEARGHLTVENGRDIGWRVLLRPRKEWEARPDFVAYMRPKQVVAIEGA